MLNLSTYLSERRQFINAALEQRLPSATERPAVLHQAMRYSALAGGKRIRPILTLAASEAVGAEFETTLMPALAVEILHTYTLIHDDLPCMDDDELRRGMPTLHVKFGEAEAVLAGDALLTLAFEWVADPPAPSPYRPTQLVLELARAAGSRGVVGGQIEDLAAEGRDDVSPEDLEFIHLHKTASLIRAALRMGAIAGGASPAELDDLTHYGASIGLAFQIADDILNVTATAEDLGKPVGSDADRAKSTYVAMYGLDRARRMAQELVDSAIARLSSLPGRTEPLDAIARYIIDRGH